MFFSTDLVWIALKYFQPLSSGCARESQQAFHHSGRVLLTALHISGSCNVGVVDDAHLSFFDGRLSGASMSISSAVDGKYGVMSAAWSWSCAVLVLTLNSTHGPIEAPPRSVQPIFHGTEPALQSCQSMDLYSIYRSMVSLHSCFPTCSISSFFLAKLDPHTSFKSSLKSHLFNLSYSDSRVCVTLRSFWTFCSLLCNGLGAPVWRNSTQEYIVILYVYTCVSVVPTHTFPPDTDELTAHHESAKNFSDPFGRKSQSSSEVNRAGSTYLENNSDRFHVNPVTLATPFLHKSLWQW